jgi:hypothetical protein
MTLTSLLAFASGAVMARFNKAEPDDKDKRIAQLEAGLRQMAATLRATTEQLRDARFENGALRTMVRQTRAEITDLYGLYQRPLSPEQQAEFGRQFGEQRNPQLQMQAGLAYPVPGQVQRELAALRYCTCVPARADMLRGLTVFNDERPGSNGWEGATGPQGEVGPPPNEWKGVTGATGPTGS